MKVRSEREKMVIAPNASQELHRQIDAYLEARSQEEWSRVWDVMMLCESPIEQMLLASLAFMRCPLFFSMADDPRPRLSTRTEYPGDDVFKEIEEIVAIFPQQKVLSYRADFLLVAKFEDRRNLTKVVIECDGHEFHERTKEQAKRDRARDRALTAAGYKVFRFTGSEIFRGAGACAAEIEKFLKDEEYRTRV